jgi:hypothetical protein
MGVQPVVSRLVDRAILSRSLALSLSLSLSLSIYIYIYIYIYKDICYNIKFRTMQIHAIVYLNIFRLLTLHPLIQSFRTLIHSDLCEIKYCALIEEKIAGLVEKDT